MSRDVQLMKAKRIGRRLFPAAFKQFCEPIFNTAQVLTLAASVIGTFLILRTGDAARAQQEMSEWWTAAQAFGIVLVGWAVFSLLRAPFIVVRQDREKGAWHGQKRIYYKPELVAVCPWSEADNGKVAQVTFEDAEPDSLVDYVIELHPPVAARASCYLEGMPGMLANVLASMHVRGPDGTWRAGGAKLPGRGSTKLVGRVAYLHITLEPGTVPVTARVYCHSFTAGSEVTAEVDGIGGANA